MPVVSSPPDALTQGSRLLLPHISTLLQYLGGVVRNTDRLKKKKFRAQVAKELNILSKSVNTPGIVYVQDVFVSVSPNAVCDCVTSGRVSRFVTNKEQSSVLVSLLLPYLQRANNPQVRPAARCFVKLSRSVGPSWDVLSLFFPVVFVSGDRNRHPGHSAEPAATV